MKTLFRSLSPLLLLLNSAISYAQGPIFHQLNGPEGVNGRLLAKDQAGKIFTVSNQGEVYRSSDEGTSWTLVWRGGSSPQVLIVDSSNALLLSNSDGLWRSTDAGETWDLFASGGLEEEFVWRMVVHPTGSIIATTFSGIFSRWDTSSTWNITLPGVSSRGVTVGPDSSILVASAMATLLRSTNGGATWDSVSQLPTSYPFNSLAVSAAGTIFAADPFSIHRSTDNGQSWLPEPSSKFSPTLFTDDNDWVFAATAEGLFTANDEGAFWTSLTGTGIPHAWLNTGLETPSGNLMVGGLGGIYVSSNNGGTWEGRNGGLLAQEITDLTIDDAGHFFTASKTGVFRSTDSGTSWQIVGPGPSPLYAASIFASTNGYLLATMNGGIHRSTDEGATWTYSGSGTGGTIEHYSENSLGYVFCGAQGWGLYRSTDQGMSWTLINNGIPQVSIQELQVDHNDDVYALYPNGDVYRSTNNGDIWNLRGTSGQTSTIMYVDSGIVLLGTRSYGMARSTDGGTSFQSVPEMAQEQVTAISRHPGGSFLASAYSGIYRSLDEGATWTLLDSTMKPVTMTVFRYAADGSSVAGSMGRSVFLAAGLSPFEVKFDVAALGDTSFFDFRIKNTALSSTQYTLTLFEGSSFSILTDVPVTIPAQDSADIALAFHPEGFGEWIDSLFVSSALGDQTYVLLGSSPHPELVVSVSELEFPPAAVDSTHSLSITISNPSINTLEADSIYTSSGRFLADSISLALGGGQNTDLSLSFNPNTYGLFADTLYFRNNSQDEIVKLPLSGSSPAPLLGAIDPLVQGPVALADTAVGFITLRNLSPVNPLSVTARSNTAPVFFMDPFSPFEISGGGFDTIVIRFNVESFTPDGYGTHLDTLTIESDGGTVKVPLTGLSPRPAIEFVQSPVFEMTAIEDTSSSTLILTNTSVNTLIIDSIKTQTSAFEVTWVPVPVTNQDTLQIQLQFLPTSFGWQTDSVRIWSNAEESEISFEISAECPFPVLTVEPAAISFENVLKDSTEELFFIIIDSSISKLRIDSLWTNTPYFDVTKTPPENYVLAWDTMQIAVRFTPDSSGEFSDSLYIANNSGVPVFRIHLFGNAYVSSVSRLNDVIPTEYQLFQNYPNPFNPSTTLRFGVPVKSYVRMAVYDILGRQVALLADQELDPGYYERVWNGDVSSGLYFCRIEATSGNRRFLDVKKLILLK